MGGVTFKLEGIGSVEQALKELEQEIGDKQARSKVLVPAVREAIGPVLSAARSNAPVDTGGLLLSLQVEARRPNRRDRRSKYITSTDTVIAAVTTASGKKLKQMSEGKGLLRAQKRLKKAGVLDYKNFQGIKSDARAVAQEFGSAHNAAHPYLRPALEANATNVVQKLASILARRISEYRMKK